MCEVFGRLESKYAMQCVNIMHRCWVDVNEQSAMCIQTTGSISGRVHINQNVALQLLP